MLMTTFARTKMKGICEKSDCKAAWTSGSRVLVHQGLRFHCVMGCKRREGGEGRGEEAIWGFCSLGRTRSMSLPQGCLKPWLAYLASSCPSSRSAARAVLGTRPWPRCSQGCRLAVAAPCSQGTGTSLPAAGCGAVFLLCFS